MTDKNKQVIFQYKVKKNLDERMKDRETVKTNYPDRIPIIVELDQTSKTSLKNNLLKTKYLLPNDMTVTQFVLLIRKNLEVQPDHALFFLANGNRAISGDQLMSEIYNLNKDPEDGFLYILIASEMFHG